MDAVERASPRDREGRVFWRSSWASSASAGCWCGVDHALPPRLSLPTGRRNRRQAPSSGSSGSWVHCLAELLRRRFTPLYRRVGVGGLLVLVLLCGAGALSSWRVVSELPRGPAGMLLADEAGGQVFSRASPCTGSAITPSGGLCASSRRHRLGFLLHGIRCLRFLLRRRRFRGPDGGG